MTGDGLRRPVNAPAAGQIATGVQPGISSGIVIANRVIIVGANGGIFVYSGTPAAGNLIATVSSSPGTDNFGNPYLGAPDAIFTTYNFSSTLAMSFGSNNLVGWHLAGGVWNQGAVLIANFDVGLGIGFWEFFSTTIFDQAVTFDAAVTFSGTALFNAAVTFASSVLLDLGAVLAPTAAPAAPGSGAAVYADTAGNAAMVSSLDSQAYIMGSRVFQTSNTILINSTSPIVIVNPQVGVGSYQFEVLIVYLGGQAAGQPIFTWGGSSTVSQVVGHSFFTAQAGGSSGQNAQVFNGSLVTGTGPVLGALNQKWAYYALGNVTFSGAGTFTLFGHEGTGGDTWSVGTGSYMKLVPTS